MGNKEYVPITGAQAECNSKKIYYWKGGADTKRDKEYTDI